MNTKVLREAGYQEALLGLSLSYNSEPSSHVADNLAWKGNGESKYLESMQVWLDVNAPRYFWQEFDTYRSGITKQSGSTMHTLMRRYLNQEDFEGGLDETILLLLNNGIQGKDFRWTKRHLPESFLQRRIICTNYKVLQHMWMQRKNHKLPEWQWFFKSLETELLYPEYIING